MTRIFLHTTDDLETVPTENFDSFEGKRTRHNRGLGLVLATAAACTDKATVDSSVADTAFPEEQVEPTSDFFIEVEPEAASQNGGTGLAHFFADISAGSSDVISGVDANEAGVRFDGEIRFQISETDAEEGLRTGFRMAFVEPGRFFGIDFFDNDEEHTLLDDPDLYLIEASSEAPENNAELEESLQGVNVHSVDWQDDGDGTFSMTAEMGRVTPMTVSCEGGLPAEGEFVEEMQCSFTRTLDPSDRLVVTMHRQ